LNFSFCSPIRTYANCICDWRFVQCRPRRRAWVVGSGLHRLRDGPQYRFVGLSPSIVRILCDHPSDVGVRTAHELRDHGLERRPESDTQIWQGRYCGAGCPGTGSAGHGWQTTKPTYFGFGLKWILSFPPVVPLQPEHSVTGSLGYFGKFESVAESMQR
jgi:hypothetical protein